MSCEIIRKTITEERPYPCDCCDSGEGGMDSGGGGYDCHESCGLFRVWLEGGTIIFQATGRRE